MSVLQIVVHKAAYAYDPLIALHSLYATAMYIQAIHLAQHECFLW